MKILVINGSPKGKNSVTLQTCHYLQILHPEHEFTVLHAGQTIKTLKKDFPPAIAAIEKADLLLFSYPVYTFIAPCQLQRFIELLKAASLDLSGKFASLSSTSDHFYHMTAHHYIQDNFQDLGLNISGVCPRIWMISPQKSQKEADDFFRYLCWCAGQNIYEAAPMLPPATASLPVTVPEEAAVEKSGDVVIVADLAETDTQDPDTAIDQLC